MQNPIQQNASPELYRNVSLWRRPLEKLFAALRIDSASSFHLEGGQPVSLPQPPQNGAAPPLPPHVTAAGKNARFGAAGSNPGAAALADGLWSTLYMSAYMRPFGTPAPQTTPTPEETAQHLASLREAFPEGARWDMAWKVYQKDGDGTVHVQKGDRCRMVRPGFYTMANPQNPLVDKGTLLSILIEQASSTIQPVFYHFSGLTPASDHDNAMLARIYLNSDPAKIVPLIRKMADALNGYALPFHAKTVLDLSLAGRCDGTVFYLARRYMPFALAVLQPLLFSPEAAFAPDIPLFSKYLAPGIGAADDPGAGMSFGQLRCIMLGEAIVQAWSTNDQSPSGRMTALHDCFSYYGLDPDRPYLSPGNIDIYHFPQPEEAAP